MGTVPNRRDQRDLGEQYICAMTLAGEYAYAGGDWVCDRVARMLRAPIIESTTVSSTGSCARARRLHFLVRRDSWVEPGVILEGIESEGSRLAMYSSEQMKSLRN